MITLERLRYLLRYDPKTGRFYWNPRPASDFSSHRLFLAFNARFAGNEAGSIALHGYIQIKLDGRDYTAHRLAWFYWYGQWPSLTIDHEDGNRSNNRLGNLRDVPHGENQKNMKMPSNNTSGVVGVTFCAGKWMAQIQHRGKHIYLGRHSSFDAAVKARRKAEIELGFHPNHGRRQA